MKTTPSKAICAFALLGVLGGSACQSAPEGETDEGTGALGGDDASGGTNGLGTGGALGGQGGDAGEGPLFAVMYEVFDDSGSTSYLSLQSDLDVAEIDSGTAREYGGGRAFVQAYGGNVFVGDAATPTVTRYAVDDDGKLSEEGKISFANYGLTTGQFDSWNVTFLTPDKAYLLDFKEGTTIVWNPSTMRITGDIPAPDEFLRDGWTFESTPAAVRDGLLFRTIDWANYDNAEYVPEFFLAVYDTETDEIIEVTEESRCPVPGNLVHVDEAGTIYFSNWIWPVAGAIMRDAPEPCVLRINPGATTFDPDWTLRYQDVTDGHHGAMFTYLEDGQALVAAFYEERTSFDEETDPWGYVGSMNWRLWHVDIEAKTGSTLEGIDFNGGAFTPARLDGRLHLLVPGGAEENYVTQLYEVVGDHVEPRVTLPGWSYQIVQVR